MRPWRLAAVVLLAAACTSHQATKPPAPIGEPEEPCDVHRFLAELWDVAPADARGSTLRHPHFTGAKGDVRDVYRKVAPATVLIRSKSGFGTGIVIDPRGYILTNHHVIAHGEQVDFKTKVTVERGKLSSVGNMEPEGTAETAWVLKSDPLVDLAILKLEHPPKDLKVVRLAKNNPVPGEPVAALGNGSIGLLWAIKDGEIASIGKLGTHLAQIVGGECRTGAGEDAEAAQACQRASASIELQKQRLEKTMPALVIQSSCTISPGDSGGPLVNRSGELVGVNAFLRSDARTPVTTNFHIHLDEVKRFLKEVPEAPLARAPSPWELAAMTGRWLDADGDGLNDVYATGTTGRAVVFVDLKQASARRKVSAYGFDRARVQADLAVAKLGSQWVAWYDTDGDGTFERLVVESQPDAPGRAFQIGKDGALGSFLGAAPLLDDGAFGDEELKARLVTVSYEVARQAGVEGAAKVEETFALPAPPYKSKPRWVDTDRDGVPDALFALAQGGGTWLLAEPSQQVLRQVSDTPGDLARAAELVSARPGALPLAVLRKPGALRAYLGDGKRFTEVLLSDGGDEGIIGGAYKLGEKGERGDELPAWWGRMLTRAVATRFSGASASRVCGYFFLRGTKPGLPTGFPHPVFDVGTSVLVERASAPGLEQAVVSVVGPARGGGAAMVFELDAKKLEGVTPAAREADVRQGAAGTDVAWVKRGPWTWVLYDTTHDGEFDVVLIRRGEQTGARRLEGNIVHDAPELAKGPLFRPSLLRDKERAEALKAVLPDFFGPEDIGD